jgi:DNA-binding winged helix-turn-helix (wHTH) protein
MRENPFTPQMPAPIPSFVNREREIDLVYDHIRSVQRGNVSICGPLGFGKTSLLRYLADPAVAADYGIGAPEQLLVYVDTQSVTPFSADRFWRRVVRLAMRIPGADIEAAVNALLARDVIEITDLEEFLDSLADRGRVLVLLLDEFEWALQADTAEAEAESRHFLAQAASLARRSPRVLCLVVATVTPLFEATKVIESWRGSPFATLFASVVLPPLSRGDAGLLLRQAVSDQGFQVSEDEILRLYELSSGQPAALQAAAFSLFRGRQRELSGEQLWSAVQLAVGQGFEDARRAEPAIALGGDGHRESNGLFARQDRGLGNGSPGNQHDGNQRSNDASQGQGNWTAGPASMPDTPSAEGLWIDHQSGEVTANGQNVGSLTALEFSLLRLLYRNPGRLCSKEEIIRQVWGEEFMGEVDDSRVEKLVSRLRRKIEPMPGRPQYVRTVRGRGYRYVP